MEWMLDLGTLDDSDLASHDLDIDHDLDTLNLDLESEYNLDTLDLDPDIDHARDHDQYLFSTGKTQSCP